MSRPALTRKGESGRVPTMKGCLKLKSPLPSPGEETPCLSSARKTVAFGEEGTEEVYFADVWDRTPTEPARKLTYQDLLELKEIQRSLPRANQLADPISGRPASHYLQDVPIGLLPLLSDSSSSPSSQESSTTHSPIVSPPPTPSGLSNPPWTFPFPPTPQSRGPPAPTAQAWVPPHLAHLAPKRPAQVRQKPTFAFLPLLDTPPSSGASSPYTSLPSSRSPSPDRERESQSDIDPSHDPPTPSLTNASLDSSPLSRASSASPEPSFLQLPPLLGRKIDEYGDELYTSYSASSSFSDGGSGGGLMRTSPRIDSLRFDTRRMRMRSSSPPPPPPSTAWHAFPTQPKKRHTSVSPARSDRSTMSTMSSVSSVSCSSAGTSTSECTPPPRRRRNVMIVNGIEIDLDDDSDNEGDFTGGSSSHSTSKTSTPGASGSSSRCGTPPPPLSVDEERQSRAATSSKTAHATPSPPAPCIPTRQSPYLGTAPTEHLDATPKPPTPTPKPSTTPTTLTTPIPSPIRTPTETPASPSCSPNRCSMSLCSPIRFQRDPKSAAAYQRVQKQGLASS
ncbi:hypothetical protein DXG03_001882 [Asterophora parasitica]|uniref:Uncharacterized protein n=1 Tax=Asterophora parasitica TaxID=117018 RepID=A0A9P7K8Z3_9AGAR|nr:hypothetical protein DXG03_001882 [Asterophora parasitica]